MIHVCNGDYILVRSHVDGVTSAKAHLLFDSLLLAYSSVSCTLRSSSSATTAVRRPDQDTRWLVLGLEASDQSPSGCATAGLLGYHTIIDVVKNITEGTTMAGTNAVSPCFHLSRNYVRVLVDMPAVV